MCMAVGFGNVLYGQTDDFPIRCNADSVTYNKEEGTIFGKGNVELRYEENFIRADEVEVTVKTKEVLAKGRVIFKDKENTLTGDRIFYNFDTGKGEVDGIASSMMPWYAYGKSGERVSPELYRIDNGYVSTCDYEVPHYRLKGKTVYIYPGDKIVIKHIIMYWGKVPLFYWPYYSKSLKDDKSPWTVIPGKDDKFGYYLLTGYSMWWDNFFGGLLEPTLRLDYYEKRGIGLGGYAKYKYEDSVKADMRGYYIDDKERTLKTTNASGATVEEKIEDERGRFSLDYAHRLREDIRALVELNYLSDKDIVYDYFRDEFNDEIQTQSYIDISKTTSRYQLSLMTKKRLHDFYTDLERLPELRFSLLEKRIGKTRFQYRASATAGYLRKLYAEGVALNDYSAFRYDTDHQLRYPKKYFGWLTFTPRIGTRQTFYSNSAGIDPATGKIVEDDDSKLRSVYYTGTAFSTKISRIFDVHKEDWNINLLRHLIEPRVDYTYQFEPSIPANELLNFGDAEYEKNFFGLSLRNKLQTQRWKSTWDLVDFLVSTNYYPEQYEEISWTTANGVTTRQTEQRSFSHIRGDMELRPTDWFSIDMDVNWDQYDGEIDTYNTEFVFYKDDRLSLGVGYRFLKNDDKLWTSEVNYTINSNWALRMLHRYDFESGSLEEQEYIVYRDLHCWRAALTFREYRNVDEKNFFVVLYPKAYPNVPITFGTTFFGGTDSAEFDLDVD